MASPSRFGAGWSLDREESHTEQVSDSCDPPSPTFSLPLYISPPLRGPDSPHAESLCARRALKPPACTIKHSVLPMCALTLATTLQRLKHKAFWVLHFSLPFSLSPLGATRPRNLNWMNQVSDNEQYDNGRATPPTLCSLFKFRVVPGIENLWGWPKKIREYSWSLRQALFGGNLWGKTWLIWFWSDTVA